MAAVRDPLVSFVWGKGGAALTPEEIAQQRELEKAVRAKGIDTSPVGHWTQGAARVAEAIAGAFQRGSLDKAEAENTTYNEGILNNLLGGGGSAAPTAAASIPAPGGSAEIATTAPSQPIDMTGNEVYSGFMDTVKSGVQNPYALAAIAATGQRESQFSPGNVNRTWSDPSESGQPGTAGGIMSWRGPRYDALAATGDLSPQGQAKFFLQENPQLIQALNSAGSLEEAQSLMNKAWAFAGHDRPGGETAARLAAAQGLLPSFQATGEVAAATPEAAIEAISPTQGGSLADEVAAFEQTPAYSAQFPGAQAPAMEPAQEVGPAPVVAGQPMQAEPQAVDGAVRVAQALPAAGQPQQAAPAMSEALIRAITDPRATPQTRAVAQALMQQQMAQQQAAQEMRMKQSDPAYQIGLEKSRLEVENLRNPRLTPSDQLAREKFNLEKGQQGKTADINEYEYAKGLGYQGSFVDFQLAQKKAGAPTTTINNAQESSADAELRKKLSGKEGEAWSAYKEAGTVSAGTAQDMQLIDQLLTVAPQGPITGRLAEMFPGVSSAGSALQSVVKRVAPTLRAPGSGATSDIEYDGMLRSLPALSNQPEANKAISGMMKAKAAINIERSNVIDLYQNEEITAAQARRKLSELNSRSIMSPELETLFEGLGVDVREPGEESSAPEGIDPKDWEFMTPEDRALFQ